MNSGKISKEIHIAYINIYLIMFFFLVTLIVAFSLVFKGYIAFWVISMLIAIIEVMALYGLFERIKKLKRKLIYTQSKEYNEFWYNE